MSQHLIETLYLADGNKVTINDYCKDDIEFNKKLDAYYKRYSISYVIAYHHTILKNGKALTRDGRWVNIKRSKVYCKAGRQVWDGYHRLRRQYFFSSIELAEYIYKLYKPCGATLQGRLLTVPFGIGIGKTYVEWDFRKIRAAF